MVKINYFPTYLASGNAFCNRQEELKRLHYDLENNTPILLISPRRYGKTSLALKSFELINWPYAHVDLYKALSAEDIERYILSGIGKLLGKLETAPKKLLKLAGDSFSSMQIKVVYEPAGVALDFSQKTSDTRKKGLMLLEALEKLEYLADQKKRKVILYLDEFQAVGEVESDYHIEAVLREAAQKSKNIVYVFSGSNRHLIEQMFYDKKRPFYKLCDNIHLTRISETHYTKYIQHAAKTQLGQQLSEDTLNTIYELTERHPYYVNKLCSLVWQINEYNKESIYALWKSLVLENKSVIEREISLLSLNQRKMLLGIANSESTKEIQGKQFAMKLGLSTSSIAQATKTLIEKDYIYIDESGYYKVVDPLINGVLTLNINY